MTDKNNNSGNGNSQFIHESLELDNDVKRTMVRITLPIDYPMLDV